MALRLLSKELFKQRAKLPLRAFSATAASTTETPSVFDNLINLTIVDPGGARRKIPGMVGKLECKRSFLSVGCQV